MKREQDRRYVHSFRRLCVCQGMEYHTEQGCLKTVAEHRHRLLVILQYEIR